MNGHAPHAAAAYAAPSAAHSAAAKGAPPFPPRPPRSAARALSLPLAGLLLLALSFGVGFFNPSLHSPWRPHWPADVSVPAGAVTARGEAAGPLPGAQAGAAEGGLGAATGERASEGAGNGESGSLQGGPEQQAQALQQPQQQAPQQQQQQQQLQLQQESAQGTPALVPEHPEEPSLEEPEGQQASGPAAGAASFPQAEGHGAQTEALHSQPQDLPGKPLEGAASEAEEGTPLSTEAAGTEAAAGGQGGAGQGGAGQGGAGQGGAGQGGGAQPETESGAASADPVVMPATGTPAETGAGGGGSGSDQGAGADSVSASVSAASEPGAAASGRRLVVGESRGQGLGRVVDLDVLNATGDGAIPPFPRPPGAMRVAVCLVGGARDSDLTIPAIIKNLLSAYPNTHVFIHSPLDQKSFKLLSFAWAPPSVKIGAVRVFSNWWVDERAYPRGMINDINSPKGNQGMFQYFRLVEGCIPLIAKFEQAHGIRFNWIVRTRVDTFWRKPPPKLAAYHAGKYTIPFGTDCYGRNDRMGVGTWRTSRPALARLGMLSRIHKQQPSWVDLNSEKGFQAQMLVARVPFARTHFWFCVVARRVYKVDMMPVVSMASAAPLNGAKCRPCTPQHRGRRARARLVRFNKQAQLGGIVNGVDLCNARLPWEPGWERVFDRDLGPAYARRRQQVAGTSLVECAREFEALKARASAWDAPPPRALCLRRALGPLAMVGGPTTSFGTFWAHLKATSHARAAASPAHSPRTLYATLHPGGGSLPLHPEDTPGTPGEGLKDPISWGSSVIGAWRSSMDVYLSKIGVDLQAQVVPLGAAHQGQGHTNGTLLGPRGQALDVVVVAGSDGEVLGLVEGWRRTGVAPAACQLLVAFEAGDGGLEAGTGAWEGGGGLGRGEGGTGGVPAWEAATRALVGLGFWLDSCVKKTGETVERCTFFSLRHCAEGLVDPPAVKPLLQQADDAPAVLPADCVPPKALINPRRRKYCSVSVASRSECPACPPFSRCGSSQRWCCGRYMCICEGRHTTPIYEGNTLVQCVG